MLGEDARDLVAVSGNVAEAQDGAAAGGTAVGLDVAAGDGAQDDVERLARGEQGVEGRLEGGGRARLEPVAEAQELVRTVGEAGNARQRVGDDAQRLALLPEDQDLRLGADDRIGGGEAALEAARLGDGAPLSRLARTTVSQISAAARRAMPPMKAAAATGLEPSNDRGSASPKAIPAASTSTQARLAATRAVSSRDFPAGRGMEADCIGVRQDRGEPEAKDATSNGQRPGGIAPAKRRIDFDYAEWGRSWPDARD